MPEQGIVLFDGGCGLCNRLVGVIRPRLRPRRTPDFIPIESHQGRALLEDLPSEFQQIDSLLFLGSHRVHAYSSAVVRCLLRMKWQYAVWAPVLWIIPLPIRNRIYQRVAKSRQNFFRESTGCVVEKTGEECNISDLGV